ncbi:MAG: class I SAM-dependent methyltransferase [Sandaracinaceae bacterium]|nr:class I SAM-dependent methyltransferase [Sandaracinaceae bacterium]
MTPGRLMDPARWLLGSRAGTAAQVEAFFRESFPAFPWRMIVTDWTGRTYELGRGDAHFSGAPLRITLRTEEAGKDILRLDGMRFLERFLEGDVDLSGNLYALSYASHYAGGLRVAPWRLAVRAFDAVAFQDTRRASVNVKSHYDIPQEALNVYLDRVYMSYSCGMFEDPDRIDVGELLRIGKGREDEWDSLEKAQWRKFADAVTFVAPKQGETLLDVGCGYGGQLKVALEEQPFGKVVGWTHSANQAREGKALLAGFDRTRFELNEGDYRTDERIYDHITSTGMVSHVGPRGLSPYVKNIRRRIKREGRYVHHALMIAEHRLPMDLMVGIAFNKKYVWPGFHWFTLGEHTRALEKGGFHIEKVVNLTRHYAKTTAAWYERMMANEDVMRKSLGKATLRAWQVFLAGITGSYLLKDIHVYRIYCTAV